MEYREAVGEGGGGREGRDGGERGGTTKSTKGAAITECIMNNARLNKAKLRGLWYAWHSNCIIVGHTQ